MENADKKSVDNHKKKRRVTQVIKAAVPKLTDFLGITGRSSSFTSSTCEAPTANPDIKLTAESATQSPVSEQAPTSTVTLGGTGMELDMETGQGVTAEDKLLARKVKNSVDFAFNYSKLWCKTCKEVALCLERRALSETEACRALLKHYQVLESSLATSNCPPLKSQILDMVHTLQDHCKEIDTQNSKFCRGLVEVVNRQRTSFEKARKYLKDQWKAEVKRMLDAESSLLKTKSTYYRSCQIGVKLREDLAAAQNQMDEFVSLSNAVGSAAISSAGTGAVSTAPGQSGTGGGPVLNTQMSIPSSNNSITSNSAVGSQMSLTAGNQTVSETVEQTLSPLENAAANQVANQVNKQRAKVERLEKLLSDNDKKEFEQMYAYREAVDVTNNRLLELEKRKVEILCDIRLTITKSDEVVKNTLAEYFNQLHKTRLVMIQQFAVLGQSFQDYIPCRPYMELLEETTRTGVDYIPEKYQFTGFHEANTAGQKIDLTNRGSNRSQSDLDPSISARSGLVVHSDSDSDGEGEAPSGTPTQSTRYLSSVGSSNVLSSIVEFGSNLFRPDSKKAGRGKRPTTVHVASGAANQAPPETEAVQQANLEKEYLKSCNLLARCVGAIEKQPSGLDTNGIYRIPASKSKVSSLLEYLQSHHPTTRQQVIEDVGVLEEEHPLTLSGLIKTQLIALPEPLLTYNLYPQFVELGKAADSADSDVHAELIRRLQLLIGQLLPANRQLAGLIFHHLYRVSLRQSENRMNSANLGCMFGPTVLRQKPKFQVANMMDFVDNKGQIKITEVMIECAAEIFGPRDQFDPIELILTSSSNRADEAPGGDAPEPAGKAVPSVGSSGIGSASSSLNRSATIAVTPSGRVGAVYPGSSMPIYTPYGTQKQPGKTTTTTETAKKAGHTTATPTAKSHHSTDNKPLTVNPKKVASVSASAVTSTTSGDPSSGGGGALSSLMVGLRRPSSRRTEYRSATAAASKEPGSHDGTNPLNSTSGYSYIDTDPADSSEL